MHLKVELHPGNAGSEPSLQPGDRDITDGVGFDRGRVLLIVGQLSDPFAEPEFETCHGDRSPAAKEVSLTAERLLSYADENAAL